MVAEKEKESGIPVVKPSKSDGDVLGLKSIQFRMWLSFVALTALTLVILWVAQVVFYTAGLNDMSKSEVKRVGDKLKVDVCELDEDDFQEKLRVSAISGGFSAFFSTERRVFQAIMQMQTVPRTTSRWTAAFSMK